MDIQGIKKLLAKTNFLRFIRKFGTDSLSVAKDSGFVKKLDLDVNDDSLLTMDSSNVKAVITEAKYTGKCLCCFGVQQLRELLEIVKDDGNVVIRDGTTPLIVESGTDIFILAPKTREDTTKIKDDKKEAKSKSKDKDEDDGEED